MVIINSRTIAVVHTVIVTVVITDGICCCCCQVSSVFKLSSINVFCYQFLQLPGRIRRGNFGLWTGMWLIFIMGCQFETITFFATDWKWQDSYYGVPGNDEQWHNSKGSKPSIRCSKRPK